MAWLALPLPLFGALPAAFASFLPMPLES